LPVSIVGSGRCAVNRVSRTLTLRSTLTLRFAADTLTPVEDIDLRVLKLHPRAQLPVRATSGSSGLDIFACLAEPLTLRGAPIAVPTGIAIELPAGYDAQVRPRSGLSLKGVGVAFGTVDADYRGELLVTMWTFGDLQEYAVRDGDRIAQLVIARLAPVRVVEAAELSATTRDRGGHGSTGV
jgi:dUTP pyrophosphatase